MNIGELKKLIKDLPDEMQLILQKDSEGNGCSPVAGLDENCVYCPTNSWSGEVYEYVEGSEYPRVLVIYPIN